MSQKNLLVILFGVGLPQLRGRMGQAKSYAERLFDLPEIGQLSKNAAKDAIVKSIIEEEAKISLAAFNKIIEETQGYPYFLQEWGKYVWDCANQFPIQEYDVEEASTLALAALYTSFFRVRYDRFTPFEKVWFGFLPMELQILRCFYLMSL